ncbi:polyphosphate:AMP phosphotransferase [Methyloversatilis thermotolerans]|uniref:polyphosphate:AMP phosphotransferase n=1 Tax=Methyloversatilis thermotolerans TaxID=1346290 RepID=UPI000376E191|nr:polyphosphate:AMP phosphotransferase [Methyloversatilis thermotolerans]
MFDTVAGIARLEDARLDRALARLRADLLDVQYSVLEQAKRPVIVVISGVAGAGRGRLVNTLNEWMDPRHIRTSAFAPRDEAERARPHMWRYWQALPSRGRTAIVFQGWYAEAVDARVGRNIKRRVFWHRLHQIRRFEHMLAMDGALLLKFWLHLDAETQRARFKTLRKDPATRWRVTPEDMQELARHKRICRVAEEAIRLSDAAHAPWHLIDASDVPHAELEVGRILLHALRGTLKQDAHVRPPALPPVVIASEEPAPRLHPPASPRRKSDYETELERLQGRLNLLLRHPAFSRRALAIVFEGMDAAGKGGAIRRITRALDARTYRVHPVAAPTEHERRYPWLWRFWRDVPRDGRVALFDRSWYGRVLVERVEGFAVEQDWSRAYEEINAFEREWSEHGIVVCKFWLEVSSDEQLRRFNERGRQRFKRFKITPEDWRNREKWPQYVPAVQDMLARTHTEQAPWTIVAADDKYHARLAILQTLCERLEAELG